MHRKESNGLSYNKITNYEVIFKKNGNFNFFEAIFHYNVR